MQLIPEGIGNDHLGALAGDLDVTVQIARVIAEDLVQNDAGTAGGEPRVPLDPAAQLRLHIVRAVVEHGAVGIDIELGIAVVGETAAIRGPDIDERDAIGGGQDRRCLTGRSVLVGDDLGLGATHTEHQAERGPAPPGQLAQRRNERVSGGGFRP